jgi:hypothetical protein
MSASPRAKVDAFEAWLRAAGTPEEIASFTRSAAEGFVAVAGTRAITADHVEMSVRFARDAKMDVTAMERLGAALVRWSEAGEPPPPPPAKPAVVEAKPAVVETAAVGSLAAAIAAAPAAGSLAAAIAAAPAAAPAPAAPARAPAADVAKPEPAPAAAADTGLPRVSFRASQQVPPLEKPAAAADAPAAITDAPPPKPVAAPASSVPAASASKPARAPTSTPRTSPAAARAKAVAAIAVVASAGVIAWHLHDASSSAASGTGTGAAHLDRLAALDLGAEFPAGWHVAPGPGSASALGAVKTSLVARGGTDADPDDRAFVATLPLTDSLAAGVDTTDDALVKAAAAAERGTSTRIAAGGGTYATGGCSIAPVAAHTAVCRGTLREGGATLALQTYVRVGEERAVVALFVAKLSVPDPQGEADRIVASFSL